MYPNMLHGAGIFTFKTGWFLGQMLVNIPAPWSIWVWIPHSKTQDPHDAFDFLDVRSCGSISIREVQRWEQVARWEGFQDGRC